MSSPAPASPPDYRVQSEAVAARFAAIKRRPVVLELEHLERRFPGANGPVTVLRDLNFQVHRREFVCVIGPSGCGKSTLIRLLAGLDQPSSGRILLDGAPVTAPGPERGMVFQGYTLFPWATLQRNVMFGLEMKGMARSTAETEARQWLSLVGLEKYADHYPAQISGGMKQRVAIARALAAQPRILLMDEPFGALDAQTRAQMQAHLLEIWRNVDVTILFITHDLDEAVYLADRILVLKAHPGEIAEVIEVPVPRPRYPAQIASAEFRATRRRVDELIHPPASAAAHAAATAASEPLPIIRLTQAGDDVE